MGRILLIVNINPITKGSWLARVFTLIEQLEQHVHSNRAARATYSL